MKFHQLPLGARFEYQGKTYVKAGPITATSEQGGQCVIPRYALLQPLGDQAPAGKSQAHRQLSEAAVLAAFDEFYRVCQRHSDVDARTTLDAARQRFIARLHAAANE